MERLHPNSRYRLVYQSEGTIEFETFDHIPEAKHLIRVLRCDTNQETDLLELLLKPWVDLVKLSDARRAMP